MKSTRSIPPPLAIPDVPREQSVTFQTDFSGDSLGGSGLDGVSLSMLGGTGPSFQADSFDGLGVGHRYGGSSSGSMTDYASVVVRSNAIDTSAVPEPGAHRSLAGMAIIAMAPVRRPHPFRG